MAKYDEWQAAAMRIVADTGSGNYDKLPGKNAQNRVLSGMYTKLMDETGIKSSSTAKNHLRIALERQRNENWDGNCDTPIENRGHGGRRQNAGKKRAVSAVDEETAGETAVTTGVTNENKNDST